MRIITNQSIEHDLILGTLNMNLLRLDSILTNKLTAECNAYQLQSLEEICANFDPTLNPDIISMLSEPRTFSDRHLTHRSEDLTVYSSSLDEHEKALS